MAKLCSPRGLLTALTLLVCLDGVRSYRILVVVTMPAKSHNNLAKSVADILHDRGHEITFISGITSPNPRYREIGLPDLLKHKNMIMDEKMSMDKSPNLSMLLMMRDWLATSINFVFNNSDVTNLLKSKTEKFDLVIVQYLFNEELIGLGVRFDCPVILISSISLMPSLAIMIGNPLSPATVPDAFTPFTGHMDLWQRTVNTAAVMAHDIIGRVLYRPGQAERYSKCLPEEAAKTPFWELHRKVALVFSNSHVSLDGAKPLLPNAIEIGGFHISDVQPLPDDLQDLLDNAKDGAIFFSLGSNFKSSSMPPAMKTAVLRALGKLKQTVIWKFENDLPEKPKNVFIKKWLPQTSILAHQNIKFFISQGGLLSRTEAVKAGVPLLVLPIAGDQHHNAKITEEMGHGIAVDIGTITEEILTRSFEELLTNPKYRENAKKLANIFQDRPLSPRDLVLFYCEHVIRTGGAVHLSPPELGGLQLMLVDVVLVMLLPLLVLWSVGFLLCKKCRKTNVQTLIKTDDKMERKYKEF